MRKFIPLTIAAVTLQSTIAGTSCYADAIKQRDYVYAYDEEARSMDDDVFVICTDCPDSKMNEIYTLVARYSIDPDNNFNTKAEQQPSAEEQSMMPSTSEIKGKAVENKNLGIVQFRFDSYLLNAKSRKQLDSFDLTNKRVKLEGYTCTIGTDKYNKTLSQNRAKEVAKYLKAKGITVIDTTGLGKSVKFHEKAINRRVEIIEGEKEQAE